MIKKARVANSPPSSLHANKPTESTAAEPHSMRSPTPQVPRVVALVCLVGATLFLLTGTEDSRHHA
jgi:hypothetical protein